MLRLLFPLKVVHGLLAVALAHHPLGCPGAGAQQSLYLVLQLSPSSCLEAVEGACISEVAKALLLLRGGICGGGLWSGALGSTGIFLKRVEFLVIEYPFLAAVTIVPFMLVMTNGFGLKGVENLFCFVCLTRTRSPICSKHSLALRRLSAYCFDDRCCLSKCTATWAGDGLSGQAGSSGLETSNWLALPL